MAAKVLFSIGVVTEGNVTVTKLNNVMDTVKASIEAVALPIEEVGRDRSAETFAEWHIHDPDDEACNHCRQLSVKQFPENDE